MDIKLKYYFLLISMQIILVKSSFDITEYYKMPRLYEIDDYDRCLYETSEESLYCFVVSEIVPNNTIPLWNQIKEFNSFKKHHYQHDKLINGVCMNRCKDILGLPETEQKKYYAGKLTNLELNTYINNLYSSQSEKRLKYNKLINQCLNYNFTRNYNLMLRSNIEYCVSNKDKMTIELMDVVFCGIIGLICLLTLGSSLYDFKLKRKLTNEEEKKLHYKKSVSGKRELLYVSFSVSRNYYRLIAPSKDHSSFARDLRFFEAFRVFMMIGVLSNHVSLGLNVVGSINPDFVETVFHLPLKNFLTNGTLIMQTFFAMSGFLLTLIYADYEKKQKIRSYTATFIKFVVLRFIRLTPIYGLGILFATTWYTKLGNGPYWIHGTEPDKVFCKNYWWANLLYINNYVGTDQLCLAQAWYLGVDFQLFILSVALLMFISRFPKTQYFVFALGYLISIFSIIISFYKIDFQGLYFPSPEFLRYAVVSDTYFLKFFIPAHTNIGGYLSGILFAKIYMNMKKRNYNLGENKKYVVYWYINIVLGFVLVFSAEIFYIFDVTEKTLIIAFYFALMKNLYALLSAVMIIGMCFKVGGIAYKFSSLPIFRIPGRLTYCAFIIHVFIIRLPAGEYYQPIHFSIMLATNQFCGKLVITYIISFFVTLLIEFPISTIMKIIIGTGGEKKKSKIEENNVGGTQEIPKVIHTINVA